MIKVDYQSLLESNGFALNTYPDGKYWELKVTDDEDMKLEIARAFQMDAELFDVSEIHDIDTLILQCTEEFTNCIFYYDCNVFNMKTEEFMECVDRMKLLMMDLEI